MDSATDGRSIAHPLVALENGGYEELAQPATAQATWADNASGTAAAATAVEGTTGEGSVVVVPSSYITVVGAHNTSI